MKLEISDLTVPPDAERRAKRLAEGYLKTELVMREHGAIVGRSFKYFAIRILHFLVRAKALVIFPGGFGTLDELFETLTLVQCRRIEPLPVILVGKEFWRRVIDIEFRVAVLQ
jgi:predicted Rossmann-fold nucleotide-binding protein